MNARTGTLVLVMVGFACECLGYPFVTCKSTYATNGWFEYELTLHDDPFFNLVDGLALEVTQATNWLAVGPVPSGWTCGTNDGIRWTYPISEPMVRPQTVNMSFQSPYSTFRTDTNALLVMFSGLYRDFTHRPGAYVNLVGLAQLEGLVPCPASEADGSPPTTTAFYEIVPDIVLTGFLVISNQVRGVHFSWDSTFTMQVDASRDVSSWSNVAYVVGDAGSNTWTSSVPLDQLGDFFRLRLYSMEKHPELVPDP